MCLTFWRVRASSIFRVLRIFQRRLCPKLDASSSQKLYLHSHKAFEILASTEGVKEILAPAFMKINVSNFQLGRM